MSIPGARVAKGPTTAGRTTLRSEVNDVAILMLSHRVLTRDGRNR
jgi:hypothetical protein